MSAAQAVPRAEQTLKTKLDWALAYAQRGWHVFPVHYPLRGGKCSCGQGAKCPKGVGKHPATRNGFYDATTDAEQIRSWWAEKPYNIGLRTGDGLVVIDIDDGGPKKKQGSKSRVALEAQHGALPETLTSITGSGGRHLFYKTEREIPINDDGRVGKDIDVRGDGGYVVLPPSTHKSGKPYRWETDRDAEIEEIPEWLEHLCLPKRVLTMPKKGYAEPPANDLSRSDCEHILKSIPPDLSRRHWTRIASGLKTVLGEAGYKLWDRWSSRAKKKGLYPGPSETRRQWDSFTTGLINAGTLIHIAQEYKPDYQLPLPEDPDETDAECADEESRILTYDQILAMEVPEPKMLIADILPVGNSLCVGLPKVGKTIDAAQKCIAVAADKALFGKFRILNPGATMYIQKDDPGQGADIKKILEACPYRDFPMHLLANTAHEFGPHFLEFLEKQITRLDLRLVALDSYTALRQGHSKNVDIVKQEHEDLHELDALSKRTGCALITIHHSSKGSAKLHWSQQAGGTFAMAAATEAQTFIERYAELDIEAPERLVRILGRRTAKEMVLRFRLKTLDHELVFEGPAAAYYPDLKHLKQEFEGKEFGPKDVTHTLGVSRQTAQRLLAKLSRAGATRKLDFGVYELTNDVIEDLTEAL